MTTPALRRLAERLPLYGTLAAVAVVPVALWPWGQNVYGPVKWLCVLIAGAATAVGLMHRVETISWLAASRVRLATVPALAGLVLYLASVLFSVDRTASVMGTYPDYLGLATVWAAAAVAVAAGSEARQGRAFLMARVVTVSAAAVGAYAVAQSVGLDPLFLREGLDPVRVRSFLGNPGNLGVYAILVMPFAVRTALADTRQGWKVVGRFSAAALLFCILASGSRAAWIGMLAAMVVWLVAVRSTVPARTRRRVTLSVVSALTAAAVAVALFMPGLVTRLFSGWGEGSTVAWRLLVWKGTLQLILSRPLLGWGPQTFSTVSPPHLSGSLVPAGSAWRIASAHNIVLDVATASGVVAAVSLVAALMALVVQSLRSRPHDQARASGEIGAWRPLLTAALVGGFIALQFGPASIESVLFAGVDGALLCVLVARSQSGTIAADGVRRSLRWFFALTALLLAAGALAAAGVLAGDSAIGLLARRPAVTWGQAHSTYETALRLAPWEPAFLEAEGGAAIQSLMAGSGEALPDGVAALKEARRRSPRALSAAVQLGNLYLTAGLKGSRADLEQARAAYREALRIDSDSADALLGAGSTELAIGRPVDAVPLLEKSVQVDPGSTAGWDNLAQAYEAIGLVQDAAKATAEAERLRR